VLAHIVVPAQVLDRAPLLVIRRPRSGEHAERRLEWAADERRTERLGAVEGRARFRATTP
jgi:hypothetical protein